MEVAYQEMEGLNQSLLKKILESPAAFLKQKERQGESEEEHFVFGSLVDDLLLKPEIVSVKYFRAQEVKLSDKLKEITQFVFDFVNMMGDNTPFHELDDVILNGCDEAEYYPKWTKEKRIALIKDKCTSYFESLKKAQGKIIIPEEDYQKALICKMSLQSDVYTSVYWVEDENHENWKHKAVQFTYNDYVIKGELDKVRINHINKTIQPIDYKHTGKSIYGFIYDFWKFRYDFQAAVYTRGIKEDPQIKELLDKGYVLLPFRYIVVEKESINKPMIFIVTDKVLHIGWNGGTLSNGKELEGFVSALKRYDFHITKDVWDYPMEYYNQGFLEIKT